MKTLIIGKLHLEVAWTTDEMAWFVRGFAFGFLCQHKGLEISLGPFWASAWVMGPLS